MAKACEQLCAEAAAGAAYCLTPPKLAARLLTRNIEPPWPGGHAQGSADKVTVVFLTVAGAVATAVRFPVILFPELAALTFILLTMPDGHWAGDPVRLVLTPGLTGLLGLLVTRHMAYGLGSGGQLAIAWAAAKGEDIVPLVGTRRRPRLDEALQAVSVRLGPEDLERIETAIPADALAGERYAPAQMKMLDSED